MINTDAALKEAGNLIEIYNNRGVLAESEVRQAVYLLDNLAGLLREAADDPQLSKCFACHTPHMFLVKCRYYDLYNRHDGEAKERLICLDCLVRRADLRKAMRDEGLLMKLVIDK